LFAKTKQAAKSTTGWHIGGQLSQDQLSEGIPVEVETLKVKRAVKTLHNENLTDELNQGSCSHARLNYLLIMHFEGTIRSSQPHPPAIVTEFRPNGSLAEHLASWASDILIFHHLWCHDLDNLRASWDAFRGHREYHVFHDSVRLCLCLRGAKTRNFIDAT
jgi:hypothetical protein